MKDLECRVWGLGSWSCLSRSGCRSVGFADYILDSINGGSPTPLEFELIEGWSSLRTASAESPPRLQQTRVGMVNVKDVLNGRRTHTKTATTVVTATAAGFVKLV